MRYLANILTGLFLIFAVSIVNAATISLYENPAVNSKVVGTVSSDQLLIPVFTQGGWIKVANPQNGNVGWVQKVNLNQTPTLTVTQQEPGGHQYVITEKNKDGTVKNTYRVIQYSNANPLSAQQAQALFDRVQKQQQQMQENFNKMMEQAFSPLFKTLPGVLPIIIIQQEPAAPVKVEDKTKK
jgi:hypothetical protein